MKQKPSIATQIAKYQSFMKEEYQPATIYSYSSVVLDYLNWKDLSDANQTSVPNANSILEYINPETHISNRKNSIKTVRAALRLYYYSLTGEKLNTFKPELQNTSIDYAIKEYEAYMSDVAGLAEATITSHKKYIQRFLYYIFPKQTVFEQTKITVTQVRDFFTTELNHLKPVSKKVVSGVIRSFVRYLQFKGIAVDPGLLILPLSTPVWSKSGVPKTFDKKEIAEILACYDLNTSVGIRDYAIALCFTELGLRVSEVASLTLDDFNWREGKILIKKTKSHIYRELPLPTKIGEAIVTYLKRARPDTAERIVFVRFSHYCGDAMGPEQIRGTIRRAYARAGIPASITGTHILRHSKAKSMYENGSSLKMVADVLGHKSIDTTVIYTKVGYSKLQCVTCPWPKSLVSEVGSLG